MAGDFAGRLILLRKFDERFGCSRLIEVTPKRAWRLELEPIRLAAYDFAES